MNTSMGPNLVCAAAAANAAGSVMRDSFCKASYLAGQLVSMPAALLVTAIYPGQFTKGNSCSKADRETGRATLPSKDATAFLMGSAANHGWRMPAGHAAS